VSPAQERLEHERTLPPEAARDNGAPPLLHVAGSLTLTGAGAGTTTIDGQSRTRVLLVDDGAMLGITGITLARGNPGFTAPVDGGAVRNLGTLGLTDCVVRDSLSTGQAGGIFSSGTLILTRSTVSGNESAFGGGGIWSSGTLTASDSTIEGNRSFIQGSMGTSGGGGGGLWTTGTATLAGCTISDNGARTSGGGIGCSSTGGALTLVDSTVSGNASNVTGLDYAGGGVSVDFMATAVLGNVTVTDNDAYEGGGVAASSGTLQVRNSIIAGNRDHFGTAPDCERTLSSLGYNLIGNLTGCQIVGGGPTLSGVDPLLGPLADNGGPTQTRALLPGSPAIDAGNPATPGSGGNACEATDQRGLPRAQPGDALCDIGAYEVVRARIAPTTTTTTTTTTPIGTTTSTTLPTGCALTQPPGSLGGVLCAIGTIQGTLDGPPRPDCTRRCRCSLEKPLAHVSSLITRATDTSSRRRCRRELRRARRAARAFARKVRSLVRRRCLAPAALGSTLVRETRDLNSRSKGLFESRYCAAK
jgi:hypothetical protein